MNPDFSIVKLYVFLKMSPTGYAMHPLNKYEGIQDERDWISNVKGEYSSFFAFWKKVKKEIQ